MVQESEKPYRSAKEYVDTPLHDPRIRKTLLYRERKAFEGGHKFIKNQTTSLKIQLIHLVY